MIISSDAVRSIVFNSLQAAPLVNWPVYSVVPPINLQRYILISSVFETDISEKQRNINEGSILISVTEHFDSEGGTLANVDAMAREVMKVLDPTPQSLFANTGVFSFISLRTQASTEALTNTTTGRVAVRTLRVEYRVMTT
jgi:hypothetical protein